MADPKTGMDKADMSKLLSASKKEPVNCAVAQGKEPAFALLLMDKIKSGKTLIPILSKEFPEAKTPLFGTVSVDTDEDPKLAKFTLNKAPSGTAKRLRKTLKLAGYTKVIILGEDGKELESTLAEPEEGEPQTTAPTAEAAPPPPPPPEAPAPADPAAALLRSLTALAKQIPTVAAGRDDVTKQLAGLAAQAQAALKSGDLTAAGTAIKSLQTAILNPSGQEGAPKAPADTGATAGAVAFGKSRLAWLAARQKVMGDIEKLKAEIVATYEEDGIGPDLASSYTKTVQPVIDAFDVELADKLDDAVNATDPAKRGALVSEARATIERYQKFLDGETLITDLDDNPFVPLTIHATISATLAALSKTVR